MSGMPSSGVVTPEAVVLQFETAGVGSRCLARGIDLAIQTALYLVFVLIINVLDSAGGPSWLAVTLGIFGLFVVTFAYPVLFETLWSGRTPGKAALGLRVVTDQGAPIRLRHAMIRAALGTVELAVSAGALAILFCWFTKRNQRLGDLVAGTIVLRERVAEKDPRAISFVPPAGTQDYAATIDASSLTADEYITVRSFLLRSAKLRPEARQQLSDQLGRQIALRLRATPPQWMPSEIFLVCVAAAYQRRFATT